MTAEFIHSHRMLFSLDEATQMLSVSKMTLHRLVKSGKLKTVRIGSRVLINKEELANFSRS